MKQASTPCIALTTGEPAGIGPDLCIALANSKSERHARIALLGDRKLLTERAALLGLPFDCPEYTSGTTAPYSLVHIPTQRPVHPARLDSANATYVLALLDRAIAGCNSGEFGAMVTAPVHKSIINDAGIPFTGHTEYLQQAAGVEHVVMMLVAREDADPLRVALATTHLPLAEVPKAITGDLLRRTVQVLAHDLTAKFGIAKPSIFVTGLNPHAGEAGHLGREEIEIIEPALHALRARGFAVRGPLPADTAFTPENLALADAFLVMYHDQGLPVLKFASFGQGVNVTLGLPFIRTSVDHGTALDLAGTGKASSGSLNAALDLAIQLAARKPG
jgi:4-hydroxythreonine-4-phosphate dehydrogenase